MQMWLLWTCAAQHADALQLLDRALHEGFSTWTAQHVPVNSKPCIAQKRQPWQVLGQPSLGLHQHAAGGITVQTCPVATPKTLNSAYVHIRLSASPNA